MQFAGSLGEILIQEEVVEAHFNPLQSSQSGEFRIFWNWEGISELEIDGIPYRVQPNQLLFLTEFHQLSAVGRLQGGLFKFNSSFYCLDKHDGEVGCKGALFFGTSHLATIQLAQQDVEIFRLLWQVFTRELQAKDNLQLEMLRMLMKRWMILCIRMFKQQQTIGELEEQKFQLVKDFSILVEQHFRNLHHVKDYADLLHKSPKTLAHVFSKSNSPTPLQVIQDRIFLEARRQLIYSDKSIKEIAYHLGFTDQQSFSRFFQNQAGISASVFRETLNTAHSDTLHQSV